MLKLLNPHRFQSQSPDHKTNNLLLKTIHFFEKQGKAKLRADDQNKVWYSDFLDFQKQNQLFATLMTPQGYGASPDARWDTWRNSELSEILGFYGLSYWYTWQVSMLGLGPIWMSQNEELKKQTAELLHDGAIFGFGLSEKEHGADLYASEMTLTPTESGQFLAQGRKYYIGNGNLAALVSTFGKDSQTQEYVFFAVNSQHPNYRCIQNVVHSQNYVAEFELNHYPVASNQLLARGQNAWDTALNTINICKYNLGWAAIGMCTHAWYESINHAAHRKLFNQMVTDFTHVRQLFVDGYARLMAMKLFAARASDYMRSSSANDRRYLLFNPMVKMKVTTQGEEVINNLWDIIAAKGFEKNMMFEAMARDIRALPKLEGTVHVNMALIIKFMKNYFFKPATFEPVPTRHDLANDSFLFKQGPTKGLGQIQFHDYRLAYNSIDLPNLKIFKEQIAAFKRLLFLAGPSQQQTQDFDFLLILGELFTLVVYGQLIIENAQLTQQPPELLDQIFDFMIRDFSKFALQLYSKTTSTRLQMVLSQLMIRKPQANPERFNKIWSEHVMATCDLYKMSQ